MNFIAPWYNVRKSIFSRWRLIPFSTWPSPERKHAPRIVAYRSGPTRFSRFLLRGGGRRGAACHSQNITRLGNLFFSSPLEDWIHPLPDSDRRASIFSVITSRLVRVNTPPAFFLSFPTIIARHVSNKSRENASPGNEFGSFFLAHQPQLFSFNWIV